MRTDFDLPPPTISYAAAKATPLPPWCFKLIVDMRRELARQTPKRTMTKYLYRQLVEHHKLAYERAEVEQLRLDI